ncbi:hypothetical protein QR680_004002 [Steinernema hermaphroditum]|uniref:Phospholipase A2 n=1 Tax=Steinernema hermaphroditum TaxID=289476 RepID=A0AA39HNE1_9BILA|nr:hypothetical protein QR680_004002 [Steinernema hermaphroditum]
MRISTLLFVFTAALIPTSVESVSISAFQCGANEISTSLAYDMVSSDCPTLLYQINDCCRAHDLCYDEQRGRDFCDGVFCECLLSTPPYSEECDTTLWLICTTVETLGWWPYWKITVFAILSAAVLLTAAAQFVSFPEFKCGTNKITTAIAYRTAKATCSTQLDELNP